jgi:hypothetical protein
MGHSPFNIVTCFETLEHFTEPMQLELLGQIASLLGENGTVILSVPIEKGFPSLIKNIIRRFSCEKSHRHFYSLRNMWRAFHGQRFPEFRSGNEFLWSHVGFYYDDLEKLFQKIGFVIEDKKYSPFSFLGTGFNSQVFYRLRKE